MEVRLRSKGFAWGLAESIRIQTGKPQRIDWRGNLAQQLGAKTGHKNWARKLVANTGATTRREHLVRTLGTTTLCTHLAQTLCADICRANWARKLGANTCGEYWRENSARKLGVDTYANTCAKTCAGTLRKLAGCSLCKKPLRSQVYVRQSFSRGFPLHVPVSFPASPGNSLFTLSKGSFSRQFSRTSVGGL